MADRKCPVCGEVMFPPVGDLQWCSNDDCPLMVLPTEYIAYADRLAAENTVLKERVKELTESGSHLQAAIGRIDTLVVPPDQAKKDIEAVGGPVGWYCVDFDNDAVVERVRKRVKELEARIEAASQLIYEMPSVDLEADPNDTSPDDMIAHLSGLALKALKGADDGEH